MKIKYKIYVLFKLTEYKLDNLILTDYHIHSTYINKDYALQEQRKIPHSYIEETILIWKDNWIDD
jgi:hypothetical protein